MNELIKEKLKLIPDKPGSYQMYDKDGYIIYVGKAKNLKNRVRSYFVGAHDAKTQALVSKIEDFNYIITNNETEAFLLEITLIKKYSPFYNISLTDDKTYPYIEFTKEKNPKLVITRNLSKKNNRYFGPYPNVVKARETIELLNSIYKLRKCKTLPKKPCIYYEMGECNAPCINKITDEEYDSIYQEIRSFLNGSNQDIVKKLKEEMESYSKSLDFEKAKRCRDLINSINETTKKESVILKDKSSIDVYGIASDENYISISILFIRGGVLTFTKNEVFQYYFDLENNIEAYINNYISNNMISDNVFVDSEYSDLFKMIFGSNINVFTPQKGIKKNLLEMAKSNALTHLLNKTKVVVDKRREVLSQLSNLLNIEVPHRIESFDNSNLFGDDPVSSCIVYIDGKKAPKEYRKYKVKTVIGANDYETMKEVVRRRYLRLKEENKEMPNLIIVDGGEIQINAAKEALNEIGVEIKVSGLKKDKNHDTDILLYENKEYPLDKHSKLYQFLFEIQEEVHRFAITFHRTLKEKNDFTSVLDEIKGVGEATKNKLLKKYKTLSNIVDAPIEELKELGIKESTIIEIKKKLNEVLNYE